MAHLQAPVCMGKGNDTGEDFFLGRNMDHKYGH